MEMLLHLLSVVYSLTVEYGQMSASSEHQAKGFQLITKTF